MKIEISLFISIILSSLKLIFSFHNNETHGCSDEIINTIENACLIGENFRIIKPCGKRQCINECNRTQACKSVNHIKSEMECQLYDVKTSEDNALTFSNNCTYIEENEMEINTSVKQCDKLVCSDKETCTQLRDGTARCIISRCDANFTVDNTEITSKSQNIGASVDLPCKIREDGYIFSNNAIRKYICKATGFWTLSDKCKGFAFKIYNETENSNWTQSRQNCEDDGGDLVITDTQEKFNAVSTAVINHDAETIRIYFIGMSKFNDESIFKWIDGQNVTFQEWDNGHGDGSSSNTHCVIIKGKTGKWRERDCSTIAKFICEKNIP